MVEVIEEVKLEVTKKPIDKKLFAIPAFLDLMENCLKNTSQTMISQSVVSMMRSTIFLFCALAALKFLKKKLYKHHWISMTGIMSGVALVGIGYLTTNDTDTKTYSESDIIIGLVMV
jgi:drug/metabolite transporter (DMT)-like permease